MSDQAVSTNRDQLSADLLSLGAKAQSYYRRPLSYGGGDGTFNGLTISKILTDTLNANGSFGIEGTPLAQGPVRLRGLGKEVGNDRINPVRVVMRVYPDTISIDVSTIN